MTPYTHGGLFSSKRNYGLERFFLFFNKAVLPGNRAYVSPFSLRFLFPPAMYIPCTLYLGHLRHSTFSSAVIGTHISPRTCTRVLLIAGKLSDNRFSDSHSSGHVYLNAVPIFGFSVISFTDILRHVFTYFKFGIYTIISIKRYVLIYLVFTHVVLKDTITNI